MLFFRVRYRITIIFRKFTYIFFSDFSWKLSKDNYKKCNQDGNVAYSDTRSSISSIATLTEVRLSSKSINVWSIFDYKSLLFFFLLSCRPIVLVTVQILRFRPITYPDTPSIKIKSSVVLI